MTFRLLGLPEELRLAIEQASGNDTEQARLVYEAAVNEAEQRVTHQIEQSLREVQSVIGPHGSITRLQSGGIRVSNGEGIGVYLDGVLKTNIQPNGTLVIGSNISQPETTTEIFFVEDTIYNGEEFGAGDFLIGDNTGNNLKWDSSEGQLQFRYGTAINVYADTDGTLKAGSGRVILSSSGVAMDLGTDENDTQVSIKWLDDDDVVRSYLVGYATADKNAVQLEAKPYGTAKESEVVIKANGPDGKRGIIRLWAYENSSARAIAEIATPGAGNEAVARFKTYDDSSNKRAEAGADYNRSTGKSTAYLAASDASGVETIRLKVTSDGDRVQIGNDHYIPVRGSTNPNVYFNEAGEDMDFIIKDDAGTVALQVDAGAHKVYIYGVEPGGASFNDAEGDPADLGVSAADGTSTYAARRDHVHRASRRWLPWGIYTHFNPLTASNQQPYSTSLDRSVTFVSWHQEVYVQTTNNGSNYWKLQINRASDGAVVAEINTSALSANTLSHLSTTTFSIASVNGTTDHSLYMYVIKQGSPGNLYMFGPMVEVTV